MTFAPSMLAPGQSATATVIHSATQGEVDAGSITNVATATVTFDGTDYSKTDTVTVTADQAPDWTFDKSAAPLTYSASGDTITYTYVIANTGNVTLSALGAVDSVEGVVTFAPSMLAPGRKRHGHRHPLSHARRGRRRVDHERGHRHGDLRRDRLLKDRHRDRDGRPGAGLDV